MKSITKLLILGFIVFISCKTRNDSKISPSTTDIKAGNHDTTIPSKSVQDNYLIDNTSNQDNGPVYMFCEKMPEFPGGEAAFTAYLRSNIKYSQVAVSNKIEGRVKVKFIVSSSGDIIETQILKGVDKDLDDECIRVVKSMPKWKPGTIDNKPVAVSYNIPVRFVLEKSANLSGIYILPENNSGSQKTK